MTNYSEFHFRGDMERRVSNNQSQDENISEIQIEPEPYIADPELVQSVNLAIYLKRPLLIEGEAGCGKTRLAYAVAYELGLPLYSWQIRSTSKAQEGLYSYDAVLRLHDVQIMRHSQDINIKNEHRDPRDPCNYRRFGPLGQAFVNQETPSIILIDEIDKADLDFPNDLLSVLEPPWKFEIPETGESIQAKYAPIVIITSNKEKGNLPVPFLRRCIYHFIKFPDDPIKLKEIIDSHFNERSLNRFGKEFFELAIERFLEVRKELTLRKNPGTSELLDWLNALNYFARSGNIKDSLSQEAPLPFKGVLLKMAADFQNPRFL